MYVLTAWEGFARTLALRFRDVHDVSGETALGTKTLSISDFNDNPHGGDNDNGLEGFPMANGT